MLALWWRTIPQMGVVGVTWHVFRILHLLKYLCNNYNYRLHILYANRPSEVLALWWLTVPQVGVLRITWDILKNFTPPEISVERLKLETSNFKYQLTAWSISLMMSDSLEWAWWRSRNPFLHFGAQAISLERLKLYILNVFCTLNAKSTAITRVKVSAVCWCIQGQVTSLKFGK